MVPLADAVPVGHECLLSFALEYEWVGGMCGYVANARSQG